MRAPFSREMMLGACLKPEALVISHVSWSLRFFVFALACVLDASAKDIRLRKELIQTPEKPAANSRAQTAEAPADGLYILQFQGPITDAQRAQLAPLHVELVQSIPEDAFVARLNGTGLGALRALPFVRWIGPMKAEYKIHQKLDGLREKKAVTWLVAPNARPTETAMLRRRVPGSFVGTKTSAGTVLRGVVDANQLTALADSPAVLWIEPAPAPKLFDEIASEIVAGEADGPRAFVHGLGFDGAGVSVAVADSGLMDGTLGNMHPDLAGRVDAFFHYGNLSDAADEHSHGTHVAGIVAGNGATGEMDESGYLYGLGVAPGAHIIAQRLFDGVGNYEAPDSYEQLTRNAVQAGAVIGSNSWGDDTQGAYDLSAMQFDALVRDADAQTPGDQPYILEFSAGNAGPGERTIGSPAVGKNVIASGASENDRFDLYIYDNGQDTMADFSSRGPCEDGRIKPDVVAPGTWIASLQSSSATDENAWLPISPNYQYQGGTSQAGPQVSGAAAIFVQYYRETHSGQTPSPALVKGALINSAVDMDPSFGTGFVPNNDEGWGRVDLTELIGSERGYQFIDQTTPLAQGQVYETQVFISDFEEPLRVTLTYTDVPGTPLSIPALVNDLDLEVIAPDGSLYAGNQFFDGESAAEPVARDTLNNVECVYLNVPTPGEYIVRVRARTVPQDARRDTVATDQDFALVISGELPQAGHAALILDRPAYTAPGVIGVKLIDFDQAGQAEVPVKLTSTTETAPLVARLLASGSAGVFTGRVNTAQGPAVADTFLQIKHGDQIQAKYQDASPAEVVTATRRADLLPPVITEVISTNRFGNQVVIWTTDEPGNSIVRYGSDGTTNQAITNNVPRLQHSLILTNLIVGKTYSFVAVSQDEAGNSSTRDNNGQPFTFVAQPAATVLLVDAYVPSDDATVIPITEYTHALDATGVSYEVWSLESNGQPRLSDLSPFRVVIWRFNHGLLDPSTLSSEQQLTLASYIKQDGSLLISSMEIISRIGEVDFRTNVLQVAEFTPQPFFHDCLDCDEDHSVPTLEGAPGDSIGLGVEVDLDYSNYPTFDLLEIGPDVSDTFTATTNAVPIFLERNSGRTTGIRWPRDLKTPGRVIFLAFPLDAIPMEGPAPNNRVNILRNILSFLAPGVNGLGTLSLDRGAYSIPDQIRIELADSDLAGHGMATVKLSSDTDPTGVNAEMVETARRGVFEGFIRLVDEAVTPAADELRAAHLDRVHAEYLDVSASSFIQARAEIDAVAPTISGTEHEIDYQNVIVSWQTDEATDALVQFGESAFLNRTAYRFPLEVDHSLVITGLQPDRVYYYQVVSRDAAGNAVTDDNNGQLYSFRTLAPKTLPWTDDMEDAVSEWTVQSSEISELIWEHGTPDNGLQSAGHSGSKAWGSNLHAGWGEYAETFLISPGLFLEGGNRATLKFWHSYDFTAASDLEAGGLFISTNSQVEPVLLAQYDGLSVAWEEEEVDLSPYIGKVVQLIWLHQMYDFQSSGETHIGWLIDDVSVAISTIERGTIKVQSNLSQASFTIDGPSGAVGQGTAYTDTAALTGEYTVSFAPVQFYRTPPTQTKTLSLNGTITFEGKYEFDDVNGNRISDLWESEYFGAPTGANDGGGDADHDGSSDYCEFIAGTLPRVAGSVLRFDTATPLGDGRFQLGWPTAPGRSYRVLGSMDAHTWVEFTQWTRANTDRLTHTLPPLSGVGGHFFQIEVKP